jgi:hypothetical protein
MSPLPPLLVGEGARRPDEGLRLRFLNIYLDKPKYSVLYMFLVVLKGGNSVANLSILSEPFAAPAGAWRSTMHFREPGVSPRDITIPVVSDL